MPFISLDTIVVETAFRKDMGNIAALAADISEIGLLQPIGLTPENKLIFGSRRLAAHRYMKRQEIEYRVVKIADIARGAYSENEMRKAFTFSERVAILKSMDRSEHGGVRPIRNGNEQAPISALARDTNARNAALGGHTTAYEAEKIVDKGIPELVAAVDNKEISVHNGYIIAREDEATQARIMAMPGAQRRATISSLREEHRNKTAANKGRKIKTKTKPNSGQQRNVIHMPAYNAARNALTPEERGEPPRETWDEPDPDRPGLTRIQGYTAKHGHVHIIPLKRRQAQDRRAAAAELGTRLRDLDKAVRGFLIGETPLISAADLADVMTMPSKDTGLIIPRIQERIALLKKSFNVLDDYLDSVKAVLADPNSAERLA